MPIKWDHPTAIELRKEIVEGVVESMKDERWITKEDFEKDQAALTKADVNFRNTYCYDFNGSFYMLSRDGGKFIPKKVDK